MLTPEQIEAIRVQLMRLTDPVTDYLLVDIARRISEAGQLTSTASYQVWLSQQLGVSQRKIKKRLRKLLDVSHRELRKLLTQAAEVGYDFDLKRLPQVQAIPFEDNGTIQQILRAAIEMADENFRNLTQTIGMVDPYGNPMPLQSVYQAATDYAFELTSTGAADYTTAFRRATRKLANAGVITINYQSGVKTSLEAAIRRNLMGGMGIMQQQISDYNHDALGADGWEISAHANSAPDHELYQGHQYSDEEYMQLDEHLRRHIGALNCGHVASPIILGVTEPQYTAAELEDLKQSNKDGVNVDGAHYTGYEATQMQRALERNIRKQKRRLLVDKAGGDKEAYASDKARMQALLARYKEFSEAAGLRTEEERAFVAGFDR